MNSFVQFKVSDLVFVKSEKAKARIIEVGEGVCTVVDEHLNTYKTHISDLVALSEMNEKKYPQRFTNSMQNVVANFQHKFNHPLETKPTLPSLSRFVDRKGWGVLEEMVEQLHTLSNSPEEFQASIDKIKIYLEKAVKKQMDKPFILDEQEKIVHLGDGLTDELWFLLGDFCEAGIDAEPILNIVDDSNMSKLFINDVTGELYAKNDDNGKIIKSPRFFPPEERIKKEIELQLNKRK